LKTLLQIILIPFLLWSGTTAAQSISYRNLTTKDGLPSNTIYQIKQDEKGFIWIATANGLVRYDGREFQLFNPEGIKDKEILGIFIDHSDRVWFWNLKGKLFYTNGKTIKQFQLDKNIKVTYFIEDRQENYWFLDNNKQLFKLNKNLKPKPIFSAFNIFNIITVQDTVYVYKGANVHKIHGDKVVDSYDVFVRNFNFKTQPKTFRFYFKYLNNQFWFLNSKTSRLYKVDGKGNLINFGFPYFRNEIGENINNIFTDNDQNYWVLTDEGIFVFDRQETQKIKQFSIPYNNDLNTFLHDKEGSYWLGTPKHGLIIIPSFHFNTDKAKSNKETVITSLNIINNQLFKGLEDGHFFIKSLATQQEQSFDIQLNNPINKFVKGKNNNNVWLLSPVRLFELNKASNLTKINKNQVNINYKSLYDDGDFIFIGNYSGVLRVPSEKIKIVIGNEAWGRIQNKYAVKGINHRTYAIEKVKDEFWFGSTDGLYYYKKDSAVLSPIKELQNSWITHIVNQKDTVWVGTQTDGVFQIINKKIKKVFNETNGLVSNNCKSLVVESNGIIWIGTNNGINKINTNTGKIDLINNLDGLLSNDINALVVNNEKVFVGTSDGLVTFDKNIQTKNLVPPPIYLSKFQIFDKDTVLQNNYVLRHNQNNIRIHFTGVSFRSQGTFKYKYRMYPIVPDWIETQSNIVSFPILNPDEYTFEAYAINEDGVESEEPIRITIVVKAPFWQTWWFWVLVGGLALFTAWQIIQIRIRRIEERLEIENEFQQKINELKMQALQAQMNPHFIFNALNAIQHYLIIGKGEQATIYLAKFAKLIRMIFEYSKEVGIFLTDEIEFLKLYLELEKLRFKNKITVDFFVSSDIYTDDFKVPSLLIQPVIENCFKHGLLHKESGSKIKITFTNEDGWVRCVVEDNGIGREKAQTMQKYNHQKHNSLGLKITEERLNIWINQQKSEIEKIDCFKIIDLKDENGKASGTRVEMILGKMELE
jgi:ligand-binding sensor domain-containing protein